MIKPHLLRPFGFLFFCALGLCGHGQALAADNICGQKQCVKIQNGSLLVLSADDSTYQPYFIKAVGYQPTPIGRYPSDWGYASSDPRSINNNIYDDPNILNRDFPLLQKMNANTIRVWSGAKNLVSCNCSNNGRFTNYITNAATTSNADTTQNTLDLADSYGLKVIAGFQVNLFWFDAGNNIYSTDFNGNTINAQQIINNFVNYVNTLKTNRSILFWAIGNENNYEVLNGNPTPITDFENAFGTTQGDSIYNWLREAANFLDYNGDQIVDINSPAVTSQIQAQYPADAATIISLLKNHSGQKLTPAQLTAWYGLVDAMAKAAHNAEGANFHPVAVVNGGIAEIGNSADGATDAQLPDLDIWGSNVYLGQSFGTLFSDYKAKSSKPFWISEFGIDSWSVTNAANINDWGLTLTADLNGTGNYDASTQSSWDVSLWNEIAGNFPETIGGSLMEYSDEYWKPYEFYCTSPDAIQTDNAQSAGICNSNHKYFGFPSTVFPDRFSNEEWYGVVSVSANYTPGHPDLVYPRSVYYNLGSQWQGDPWPSITLNVSGTGAGTITASGALGAGLNCSLSSGSVSGICSAAYNKNQSVTLNFSSSNNSTVSNWGVNGCAAGSNSCTLTPAQGQSLNVTINAASTAGGGAHPTVSLGYYVYSYQAPASVYLSPIASETGGTISRIELYNGTTLITALDPGQAYVWTNLGGGNYSITAKAYDANGNTGTSAPVTFTITGAIQQSSPAPVQPTVNLGYYVYSYTAPASVFLSPSASEPGGTISKIELYNNGTTLIATVPSGQYYIWNNLQAGNYSVTAKAYDTSNNTGTSSPLTFTIH